ncbi:MFS transporter [Sporosarcina sp. NCCP-2222]|uniref:MFS transporter n=1 Tax=Sporosarcina sp. NCCP-2222 TaxID=2935073 RepID=UPI00208A9B0C|nr:MFS transporter [Sporosarcina sp. NCCP-2222]GKV57505.1 MFS transporter [Sporosarcina sp. NCCP-2222]
MTKRKQTIVIILGIFMVAINMRPAITSIGPMLDTIRDHLDLSNAQVSLLTSLPVLCMGIFASLAPVLNRKLGLSNSVLLMLFVIGLLTAVRGVNDSYSILLLTAFGIGISIAIIGPLLSAMIKQKFPERAASVISVYSFGMGVGASLSAGLTAFVYESTASHRMALGIWSVLALLGILFWVAATRGEVRVRQQTKKNVHTVGSSPWKSPRAWILLLFFGLQASTFFSIVTWFVPVVTDNGFSLLQAGSMLSMMTIIQILFNLLIPLLITRFPARRFWLLTILLLGLIAIGLVGTGSTSLTWVGAFVLGIPLGGLFPIALLLPLDETETAAETNSWTAMMQTGGFIMAGLLPLLIGILYDLTSNHQNTLLIIAAFFLLMIALAFLIGNGKKQEQM